MGKRLVKSYEVVSNKYGIRGVLNDYDAVVKLNFSYRDKDIEMAISRPYPGGDDAFHKLGQETIDSYIDNLIVETDSMRRLMLHHWYVDQISHGDDKYTCAHGIVSGHKRLADATFIYTSAVEKIEIDTEHAEAVIKTINSVYYCPLEYCCWIKQDETPELIPDYEQIKLQYSDKIQYPKIEEDKVLLVLSNHDRYYFNSLYYKPKGAEKELPYRGYPHVGMFQDSYLISCDGNPIDIAYFPHYHNIEFYAERTNGTPFFIENIGDATLYAKTSKGLLRLEPGVRKEVIEENAEKDEPVLPGGDLYPIAIIE